MMPADRLKRDQALGRLSVQGEAALAFGRDWRTRLILGEDFLYPSAADPNVIMPPWAVDLQTVNVEGDFVDDAASGQLRLATDATSEAQAAQLFWADQLMISPLRPGFVEFAISAQYAGAQLTADERWVAGLASVHANAEDSLDAVAESAWFRIEGASNGLLIESDDGTTDNNDVPTGVTLTPGTLWHFLRIWWSDDRVVRFEYSDGRNEPQPIGQLSVANINALALLQPIFCFQRDAGTEVNQFFLDYVRCGNVRELGAQPSG